MPVVGGRFVDGSRGGYRRELDIAVVGAGVLGLATTDALVRRGADVTCFDGRPPGSGLSGGLTRTFRNRHDDPRVVRLAVAGRAGYREWERRLGRRLVGDEGAVYAGMGEADTAGLRANGVAHHFADAARHRELFGVLAPVSGRLLVDPGGGAIRARRVIDALAGWVGDRVVPADVHSVTVPSGGGVEIQTTEAIYRARHVVLCAGTAVPRLASGAGFEIPLRQALHARPHFRVREECRGGPLPCWVDRSGEFGEWVYGSPIGSTGSYVLGLIGPDVDVPFDARGALPPGSTMDTRVERLRSYARKAMPGLAPEPVGIRVCVMTKLPVGSDGFRVWHAPGVSAVAGHNLFKLAPVLGELLADTAQSDELPATLREIGDAAMGVA
ncbi:NAD(P)/FAD-dependent oxidoreductase [Saccharothrix australiensis]|uniref:Glycine/D-amino acid oxidase-like deaminating enzyme n=1 Tax=Saccharothrix australiensis TaxID=2072 RepID=A0A495W232_9PSEU|nr:FAD-binding oxidoreductase [Saccharothrix australiensis]RKT55712.1 glycine/D-amino acid oxidase-like deaminating enzyme [Saccharothrix australiensis]